MARWSASIWWCVSKQAVKRVQRQRSSTPRPRSALKKGAFLDPSVYDAGKKIKGRKRHILVDALGLLLSVVVLSADVQDRDGAFHLLRPARRLFPFIARIFADGGYAGVKMAMVVCHTGRWKLQIVTRSDAAGLEVLPKRWIVERTSAWISRNGRLARDFERYAATVAAFVPLAMIRMMLRRIATNASS
jgi:putative transposase